MDMTHEQAEVLERLIGRYPTGVHVDAEEHGIAALSPTYTCPRCAALADGPDPDCRRCDGAGAVRYVVAGTVFVDPEGRLVNPVGWHLPNGQPVEGPGTYQTPDGPQRARRAFLAPLDTPARP